jgi:hypothetical protein
MQRTAFAKRGATETTFGFLKWVRSSRGVQVTGGSPPASTSCGLNGPIPGMSRTIPPLSGIPAVVADGNYLGEVVAWAGSSAWGARADRREGSRQMTASPPYGRTPRAFRSWWTIAKRRQGSSGQTAMIRPRACQGKVLHVRCGQQRRTEQTRVETTAGPWRDRRSTWAVVRTRRERPPGFD